MSYKTVIQITHAENGTDMAKILGDAATTRPRETMIGLRNYIDSILAGERSASIDLQIAEGARVAASGTASFSTVVAGNLFVIAGVTFTGTDGTPGATGFQTGSTDEAAVTSAVAKVNANTTAKKYVLASDASVAASGTITLSSGLAAGEAIIIGSTTLTFAAAPASEDQVSLPATATTAATLRAATVALKDAINKHSVAGPLFTATISGTATSYVITITSKTAGTAGNAVTLTGDTHAAASAAALAGGTSVVKFTAVEPGVLGNTITLTRTGAPITVSGAVLSGGVGFTASTYTLP